MPVPEQWANVFELELRRLGGGGGDLFLASLPPGYVEETAPEDAASDWAAVQGALKGKGRANRTGPEASPVRTDGEDVSFRLRPCRGSAPGDFRLRRAGHERVELSSLLPVLESFGLAAVEAVPWRFVLADRREAYVDDIGLRVVTPTTGEGARSQGFAERLVGAVQAVLAGRAELNKLNRLVVGADLDWREVNLWCSYVAYRRVVGGPRAAERAASIEEALVGSPATAVAAMRLFQTRHVPAGREPSEERAAADGVLAALSEVPELSHYDALRELSAMVGATTRSSWALGGETVALKFSSRDLAFLPAPRPMAEVFVWSPAFDALHLRFGPVARGGIRWSVRQSDLRAEVLGLARAQVKKNSLIIPTGAKGAFVIRAAGQGAEQARQCYRAFVGALLDVTDNIIGAEVVHPQGVVCSDGDDPYLVVAPDKGTADFSDLANAISTRRSFWLGDAFASGGSRGYDHKALGITARGAWLAVRRHFRALGMDAQHDDIRVVGVGDMSGDVFGNGLLQSRAVRLVAAFDHRHIFVDPTPDPEKSFAERLRLSRAAGSSWADFDLAASSPGSAVFSRQAKQVQLSAEASSSLGAAQGPMSSAELVKAVLMAPVDLIFFGGVGTFVKAPGESDAEVDDIANDEVRVNADRLRARVVAEGANLALTQRARASYSRRGGRVNADFVDNAAGVAMSDREVNLKILLGLAREAGLLSSTGRDEALRAAEGDAAAAVLAEVEGSLVALDRAAIRSAPDLPAYEALVEDLVSAGLLDREVEALPEPDELSRRREAGAGLSRPELAVVLALARSQLARSIENSDLVADPALAACARRYFPPSMRDQWRDLIPSHRLFTQLLTSELANEVLHRMGATWAYELAAETGGPLAGPAGAYWAASQVLGAAGQAGELDRLVRSLPLEAEMALRSSWAAAVDRLARWYLHERPARRPGELIDRDRPASIALAPGLPVQPGAPTVTELTGLGVPADAASQAECLTALASVGEVAASARAGRSDVLEAAEAHREVEVGLSLPSLSGLLQRWPAPDRWQRWQLHALSDELARFRAEAAAQALQSAKGATGADAGRRWLDSRDGQLATARRLIDELARARPANLALASVAVRALSDALQ